MADARGGVVTYSPTVVYGPGSDGWSYEYRPDGVMRGYFQGRHQWDKRQSHLTSVSDDDLAAMKARCHTELRALHYQATYHTVTGQNVLNCFTLDELEHALGVIDRAYQDLAAAIAEVERLRGSGA